MRPIGRHPYLASGFGALYGLLLGYLALICCAAGHGTYIPAALTSAPLGIICTPAAIFGGPIVWALLGFSLSMGLGLKTHPVFAIALVFRYAAGIYLVLFTEYGELTYLSRTVAQDPITLKAWALLFVAGEVAFWYCYSKRSRLVQTA